MKILDDFKEEIHKCSKCGLCQHDCPVYKVTGNDCSVSRGLFAMLNGVVKGDLKISKTIDHYLEMCLNCGACEKNCPSGVNVMDVLTTAKAECFKQNKFTQILTYFLKTYVFGLGPNILGFFTPKTKSEHFDKKVLFFGGCGSKVFGDKTVVKLLNKLQIEVINPGFNCCGITMLSKGDLDSLNDFIEDFAHKIKEHNITEIVVNCASCEHTLKNYIKWAKNENTVNFLKTLKINNVYDYIYENKLTLKLKKPITVTYHKPCHLNNYPAVEWILNNTENLTYIEMKNYDSCCGLTGFFQIKELPTVLKIFSNKRNDIVQSNSKIVLTSCLGCEISLKAYSLFTYKTYDLLNFIVRNI